MNAPTKSAPEWFVLSDQVRPLTLERLAESLENLRLPLQIRTSPLQAFWFLTNSLFLASEANEQGMHANSLSITRQCLEAISVIELGLSQEYRTGAQALGVEDALPPLRSLISLRISVAAPPRVLT